MTQALVETLAARGVRYLVDAWHPGEPPNGLRHFQRMVGFRIVRVLLRMVGAASTTVGTLDGPDPHRCGHPL